MWADYYKLPDNLRIDRETCSNGGAGWGNMVNDTTATTEVVFSQESGAQPSLPAGALQILSKPG